VVHKTDSIDPHWSSKSLGVGRIFPATVIVIPRYHPPEKVDAALGVTPDGYHTALHSYHEELELKDVSQGTLGHAPERKLEKYRGPCRRPLHAASILACTHPDSNEGASPILW
jgi:hypothetical protein